MKILKILSGLWILCGAYAGEVLFISTVDLHGNLDALAYLAPEIRRYPDAVKVDVGDLIQGNPVAEKLRGMPMIEALNALEYDVFVPGNHEFEFDPADFFRWQQLFRGKILGAQWKYGKFSPRRYTVIERGGFRIGVIGLGESQMRKYRYLYPELQYDDHVSALAEAVAGCRREKCHAIILLTHMAMDGSTGQIGRILRKFPQIDAVICGHSHRICRGENVNRSLVVQPGSHGEAAVLLKLHFSDHDRSLQYVTSRILRPGTDEDPGIAGIREMARRQTAKDFSRELGYFDSMERFGGKAVKLLRQISGCEAAVLTLDNGGYSGNFTEEKLFFAMPYRNRFHMVKMSRTDFQKLVLQLKRGKLKYFVDIAANAPEVINAAISDHVLKKIFDPEKMQLRSVVVFDRERLAVELEKSR